jgi:hypothetical protein
MRVLKAKGIPEPSAWRFVNREKPEWTRQRWDQAQAGLDGRALVRQSSFRSEAPHALTNLK